MSFQRPSSQNEFDKNCLLLVLLAVGLIPMIFVVLVTILERRNSQKNRREKIAAELMRL